MSSPRGSDVGKPREVDRPEEGKLSRIQSWQQNARLNLQEHPTLIGDLFRKCVELFRIVLNNMDKSTIPEGAYTTLKDSLETLFLWGHGYAAEKGQLDLTLQKSKELYDSVLSLLTSIAKLVTKGMIP